MRVIIDGMNWLARAFFACPPTVAKTGEQTNAVGGFLQMLLKVDREHHPSHLDVVFDHPGKNWRHQIYPSYKATRTAKPAEFLSQIQLAKQAAEVYGCQVYCVEGFEADDVIATLAKSVHGEQVLVCSNDKDLQQLCTEDVRILAYKDQIMGPAEVEDKWGVLPGKLADSLAITGDDGDNVPGIVGVGHKTAAELVNRFGNLDGVVEHAREIGGKRGQAIVDGIEIMALARKLVALRTDVEFAHSDQPMRRNRAELLKVFERYDITPPADLKGGAASEEPAAALAGPLLGTTLRFEARIGDVLDWDKNTCSVLLVQSGSEATQALQALRDKTVAVMIEVEG